MASKINVDIGARTVKMTPYATDTAVAATDSDVTSDSSLLNDNETVAGGGAGKCSGDTIDHVLTTKSPTRSTSTSSTQSLFVSEDENNPLADFMSGDLMAKPFTYVTKTEKSLNPFRKKSGLMNVLARSSTKNRICTKKGILNIFSETDGKDAKKFLGDIFVSIIELNWGWINFIFAAGFFVSWVAFALIWYIIFWVHGDFLDHDSQLWKLDGSMLQNKEGLWKSNDTWNFKNYEPLDGLIYIENIDESKFWGATIDGKVILEDFEEGKAEQLWKKGEPNVHGYFTLESYNVSKVITANSSASLELKDHISYLDENFTPCATDLKPKFPFTSSYLFSLETQHTIGYGFKATTEECPSAIILVAIQSIVGVIISTCMAGIIFAKFTMPGKRGQTIVFSKNAVISIRNGALYLICRLCDLRKTSLLEPHVRMVIIRQEVTEEGETIPYQQSDLKLTTEIEGNNDKIGFGVWPVTIAHKIDEKSPFYDLKPAELLKQKFEIIVTLGGVTEETGNSIQVKTSYVPNEIMWGHQFDHNILEYDTKAGCYQILHSKIHAIDADETPRLSAKQLMTRPKRKKATLTKR